MKVVFLCLLVLGFCFESHAAPRMDSVIGSGNALLATVLPDHQDSNLFYVFPQNSEILTNDQGRHDFHYLEERDYRRRGYRVLSAQLNLGIKVSIASDDLKTKINEIKMQNPRARFAVVSPFKTEVLKAGDSNRFFKSSQCTEIAGPLEVPVHCSIEIHPYMSRGFRSILTETQTHVFQYVYYFYGVANGVMGTYSFSVPLRVGSLTVGAYFFDQFGKRIQ